MAAVSPPIPMVTPAPMPASGPPPVDPAEALIVTVGVEPFLRHTSRDLTGAILRSERLMETVEAQIYRFLGREEAEEIPERPPFDFAEVSTLLDNPPEPGQIGKTMAAFGDHHDMALAVGTDITRIVTYLRQQLPRRARVGMAGPEDFPPARSEELRFRRCWRLAVDPMSLFEDLQSFAVDRGQVACFSTMFPTASPHLWPIIQAAMVRKRLQVKDWQPARRQELQLRVLGRQEAPLLALQQALTPIYAAEAQAQVAAQNGQPASKDVSQADEGTPTSRLDAAS